jgi:hypothetical protein
MRCIRFIRALASVVLLAAFSSPAYCQDGTIKVIVQNEIGGGKNVVDAVVFLSQRIDGVNGVARQLVINNAPVSATNPLTDMNQAEVNVENDNARYKWAKLRYRVADSTRQQFTAAFVVANQGDTGRNHYIQQMFIRPRSEDGSYSQSQTDALISARPIRSPRMDNADRPSSQDETIKVIVQNEIGGGKNVVDAVVFLSQRIDGANGVARQLVINNAPVSATNPLTDMNQAEVNVENDNARYKWAKLRYRVADSTRQQFTAAFVVANQGDTGRNHYIQQMFIRPRSEDGSYSQSQTEAMVSTRALSDEDSGERSDVPIRTATGRSDSGDIQEALEEAVRSASEIILRESGVTDALVNWRIKETSGRWGSLLGLRQTSVSIEFALPNVPARKGQDARTAVTFAPGPASNP